MAKVLIHLSSTNPIMRTQASTLQSELELMGYEIDISNLKNSLKLFKKKYDVLHILSENNDFSLTDVALMTASKMNRVACLVSTYKFKTSLLKTSFYKILKNMATYNVDALSCSNTESLKQAQAMTFSSHSKISFLLPLLPSAKNIKNKDYLKVISNNSEIQTLRIIQNGFNDLLDASCKNNILDDHFTIDGSVLLKNKNKDQIIINWNNFLKKNPKFKNCKLILDSTEILNFIINNKLIIDISYLTDSLLIHEYISLIFRYNLFTILNKNQATGFSEYWIHQENCWIQDLKKISLNKSYLLRQTQLQIAKDYFNQQKKIEIQWVIENKMNELSRVYAKIMSQKKNLNISYKTPKLAFRVQV